MVLFFWSVELCRGSIVARGVGGGGLLDDCGGQVSVDLECLVEFSMVVRGVCCGLSKLQH